MLSGTTNLPQPCLGISKPHCLFWLLNNLALAIMRQSDTYPIIKIHTHFGGLDKAPASSVEVRILKSTVNHFLSYNSLLQPVGFWRLSSFGSPFILDTLSRNNFHLSFFSQAHVDPWCLEPKWCQFSKKVFHGKSMVQLDGKSACPCGGYTSPCQTERKRKKVIQMSRPK